jgi:hypothetical protein
MEHELRYNLKQIIDNYNRHSNRAKVLVKDLMEKTITPDTFLHGIHKNPFMYFLPNNKLLPLYKVALTLAKVEEKYDLLLSFNSPIKQVYFIY